jgi:hypothetical protein
MTAQGKPVWGCVDCVDVRPQKKLYTGKKVWAGSDADGPRKNKEKIEAYGERITRNAAEMRRRNPGREGKD